MIPRTVGLVSGSYQDSPAPRLLWLRSYVLDYLPPLHWKIPPPRQIVLGNTVLCGSYHGRLMVFWVCAILNIICNVSKYVDVWVIVTLSLNNSKYVAVWQETLKRYFTEVCHYLLWWKENLASLI